VSEPVEDQASSLRRLLGGSVLHSALFIGGDPGIGQTALVAATAAALARRGHAVLVVDGQPQLRSGAGWFGLSPRDDLAEALCGRRRLDEVLLHAGGGITWACAARLGPAAAVAAPAQAARGLREADTAARVLAELAARFDCVLIDVPADRADRWWPAAAHAGVVLLGSTSEARSVTAAYSALKMLALEVGQQRYLWWMGRAADPAAAEAAWDKVAQTARRFLQLRVEYAGAVPLDAAVPRAQRLRRPLASVFPASPAAAASALLAQQIDAPAMPVGSSAPEAAPEAAWRGLLLGDLPLEAVPAQNRGVGVGAPGRGDASSHRPGSHDPHHDSNHGSGRDSGRNLHQNPPRNPLSFSAQGRTALVSR
jgi:flagellar biosynthesis protein FlhG